MMPRWVLQEYFESGELVELSFEQPLGVTQNQHLGIYMLYQKHAYSSPKVKAAVDFITARVRELN